MQRGTHGQPESRETEDSWVQLSVHNQPSRKSCLPRHGPQSLKTLYWYPLPHWIKSLLSPLSINTNPLIINIRLWGPHLQHMGLLAGLPNSCAKHGNHHINKSSQTLSSCFPRPCPPSHLNPLGCWPSALTPYQTCPASLRFRSCTSWHLLESEYFACYFRFPGESNVRPQLSNTGPNTHTHLNQ